jgi:hypothetical protein
MLTHSPYLTDILIPVAIGSAANPCSICQEPYTEENPPVLLSECGHIFCRPCITAWFNSGLANANTCPLDRKMLFLPPTETDSNFPSDSLPIPHRFAAQTSRNRAPRPVVELFMGGEIIAVDGMLTKEGCQCVVWDLWFYTARLLRFVVDFNDDIDALTVDVEVLRSWIQDALPRGIRCGEVAWTVLTEIARQMLVWHSEEQTWGGGWNGGEWLPVEDLRGFVEGFHEAASELAER